MVLFLVSLALHCFSILSLISLLTPELLTTNTCIQCTYTHATHTHMHKHALISKLMDEQEFICMEEL